MNTNVEMSVANSATAFLFSVDKDRTSKDNEAKMSIYSEIRFEFSKP